MSNEMRADGKPFYKFGRESSAYDSLVDQWGQEFTNLPDHLQRFVVTDYAYASDSDRFNYVSNIRHGNLEAYALALVAAANNMFRVEAQKSYELRFGQ